MTFDLAMSSQVRKRWYRVQWYSDLDTKEEKKLINKIDLFILPYAVLSYWVKYIDQSNLSASGQ